MGQANALPPRNFAPPSGAAMQYQRRMKATAECGKEMGLKAHDIYPTFPTEQSNRNLMNVSICAESKMFMQEHKREQAIKQRGNAHDISARVRALMMQ